MQIPKRLLIGGLGFAGVSGVFLARFIEAVAREQNLQTIRVLDIGSGPGRPWSVAHLFAKNEDLLIDLTAIDAVPGETHGSSAFGSRMSFKQIQGELFDAIHKLDADSFDLVVCMDVIEHLSRSDGYRLVYEMNRISKGAIALSCPNGFSWQPPSEQNPFQAHISAWSVKDFRDMGFRRVKGSNGLRVLTLPFQKKKYSFNILTAGIFLAETLIVKAFPSLAALLWVEQNSKLPLFEEDGPGLIDRFILS